MLTILTSAEFDNHHSRVSFHLIYVLLLRLKAVGEKVSGEKRNKIHSIVLEYSTLNRIIAELFQSVMQILSAVLRDES